VKSTANTPKLPRSNRETQRGGDWRGSLFGLQRIDGISMDAHFIKIKNVHMLEEVNSVLTKDIIVDYMIQALP
jgi:hypothetical protein